MAAVQTLQTEVNQCKVDLLALSEKSLEHDFKESINSMLNRETSFQHAVDTSLAGVKKS